MHPKAFCKAELEVYARELLPLSKMKSLIVDAKYLVVKVGSSLVTNNGEGLDRAALAAWASQIAQLIKQGKRWYWSPAVLWQRVCSDWAGRSVPWP
jgi:hypothetical protein